MWSALAAPARALSELPAATRTLTTRAAAASAASSSAAAACTCQALPSQAQRRICAACARQIGSLLHSRSLPSSSSFAALRSFHSASAAAHQRRLPLPAVSALSTPSALHLTRNHFSLHTFQRALATAAGADAKPEAGKAEGGAAAEGASSSSANPESNQQKQQEGQSEESVPPPGGDSEDAEPPRKPRSGGLWTLGKIVAGALLLWGTYRLSEPAWEWLVNYFFLHQLEKQGVEAIPKIGSAAYTYLQPSILGNVEAVRRMLIEKKDLLDNLIQRGLCPEGLKKGVLGVGSDTLGYEEMARAQWLLNLLVTASQVDRHVRIALRDAHWRSKDKQKEMLEHFKEEEQKRVERESQERQRLIDETFRQLEAEYKGQSSVLSSKKKEFLSKLAPVKPAAATPDPTQVPLTLLQILVRHGLHRLPKDFAEDYVEEFKNKKRAEMKAAEAKTNVDAHGAPTAQATSMEEEAKKEMQRDIELSKLVEEQMPIFRALVDDQVEKTISPYAWSLLKLLVEPLVPSSQHLYGGELESFDGPGEELTLADKQVRNLRLELVDSLIPICFYLAPPAPGVVPIWGLEGNGAATEVLGTILFDIPDLSATAKRLPDASKGVLFQAMANLGALYAEQNYPGAAVHALKAVLQIDPLNHAVMTQLAIELIKVGQLQQLRQMEQQAGQNNVVAAPIDPKKNPKLGEALTFLRKALSIDPMALDANFHFLKTLLLVGEVNDAQLNSAADKLMAAIRNSPTTQEVPLSSAAPAGADGVSPFAEPLPTLSPAYNLLIRCLERLNRFEEATELAREWSYRLHADAIAHFTLGRLAIKYEKDSTEAERALRTALDLDPSKPESYYQFALLKYKQGDLEQSEEYVQLALKHQEKVERKVREKVNRQMLDQSLQSISADGQQSITPPAPYAVHNNIPNARLLLSKILARKNDLEGALREVDSFIRERPSYPEGYIQKAAVLQQSQQTLEAYKTFTTLLRLWQKRITAPATIGAANQATPAPAKPRYTRKSYFDQHPKEKAILERIDQTCAMATGGDKKAAAAQHAQLMQVEEFRAMYEQLAKLKAIK